MTDHYEGKVVPRVTPFYATRPPRELAQLQNKQHPGTEVTIIMGAAHTSDQR